MIINKAKKKLHLKQVLKCEGRGKGDVDDDNTDDDGDDDARPSFPPPPPHNKKLQSFRQL